MRIFRLAAPLLAAMSAPVMAQDDETDPYIWLEEFHSPRADAWVAEHNAATVKRLEADPRYQTFYDQAYAVLSAPDRIPTVSFRSGMLYNFWQDSDHLRGIWRRTTMDSYRTADPQWETVLDIDALGKAEGKSWVYKGVSCLPPENRLCLVSLSEGGADATETREFDLEKGEFVAGGFFIPMSIHFQAWEDADHLLVSTNWTGDDMTTSDYPYIVKRVTRGQPLSEAVEVFRGEKTDVGASAAVIRDGQGNRLTVLGRTIDTFNTDYFVTVGGEPRKLAIPPKAKLAGMVDNRLIVALESDWTVGEEAFPSGAVVSLDRDAVAADPGNLSPTLVWAPGPREAIEGVSTTHDRLVLATLDNVNGRILSFAPVAGGGWTSRVLPLPDKLALGVSAADDDSNRMFVSAAGFLTPSTLYFVDAASGAPPEPVKAVEPKFSAPGYVVEQREATSSDGTRIPYFLVHDKDAPMDGTTPTLLYAYGGFSVSQTPSYSATIGKLWLERGGAFALANIRGGGEFGPAWHDAGLGVKRQIIYDDFTAVSRDLIASGLTSPEHLGIYGGSNGGLLMGVAMTQHPELYKAIGIQVPLLDMIRIARIARGASWQGEYGDVNADPQVRAFWEKISPYQNLDPAGNYPEPYIYTTTRDDRVGPQHARKFAARMEEYGLPFLFYENTEGGHGSGADIRQSATTYAQMYTYFAEKLGLK